MSGFIKLYLSIYIPYVAGTAISWTISSPSLNFGQVTRIYGVPFLEVFVSLWTFSLKCKQARMCLKVNNGQPLYQAN